MEQALQAGGAFIIGAAGIVAIGLAAGSIYVQRHQVIAAEKKKWQQDHTIIYDKIVRDANLEFLENGFRNGDELTLGKVDRSYMGVAYEHWFVTDGNHYLEFGAADIDLDRARVHISSTREYMGRTVVESAGNMSEAIRDRMRHVLGMANYSLCLRNCEHVANYVFRGRWVSHQMDNDNALMLLFRKHIATEVLSKVNAFPASLRPHIFDADQERVPMYRFITNSFLASRFEYYLDSSREDDYNILVVGPTGVGKSRLINVLFNQEICESDVSLESVTREVYFIRGRGKIYSKQKRKEVERDIIIADTVGLCDQKWDDDKVLAMIKGRIGCNVKHLDAVFILFNANERLPKEFPENVWKILKWLGYPKCSSRFKFLGTKADYLEEKKKRELEQQFYRNFKLQEPRPGEELVTFVAFPAEDALKGNKMTTVKTQESWNTVRAFLHDNGKKERIEVPGMLREGSCVVL